MPSVVTAAWYINYNLVGGWAGRGTEGGGLKQTYLPRAQDLGKGVWLLYVLWGSKAVPHH